MMSQPCCFIYSVNIAPMMPSSRPVTKDFQDALRMAMMPATCLKLTLDTMVQNVWPKDTVMSSFPLLLWDGLSAMKSFFKPVSNVVTNLKLRGSWGLVGMIRLEQ